MGYQFKLALRDKLGVREGTEALQAEAGLDILASQPRQLRCSSGNKEPSRFETTFHDSTVWRVRAGVRIPVLVCLPVAYQIEMQGLLIDSLNAQFPHL